LIRINLLPIRQFKRKESLRRQLILFVVSIMAVLAVMGGLYFITLGSISTLEEKVATLDAEEKKLAKQVAELNQLKKEEEALTKKLQVIAELEAARRGPVRILDEISLRIPAQRAWLTELTQTGTNLSMRGLAIDNETIALLMAKFEESDYLANVRLVKSEERVVNEIKLKDFTITVTGVIPVKIADVAEPAAGAATN
jgi:type IV pilus assembly protein PilN